MRAAVGWLRRPGDSERRSAQQRTRKAPEADEHIITAREQCRISGLGALRLLAARFNRNIADHKQERHSEAPGRGRRHPVAHKQAKRAHAQPGQHKELDNTLPAIAKTVTQPLSTGAHFFKHCGKEAAHGVEIAQRHGGAKAAACLDFVTKWH